MNQEKVNSRICAWQGWRSIGLVVNDDEIAEYYALEGEYQYRGKQDVKAKRILPFYSLPNYYRELELMLEILLETQLLFEMGITKRKDYWEGEYYAIIRGKSGESARIVSDTLESALAEAFVSYLDKYGDEVK